MKLSRFSLFLTITCIILSACSTTKSIPEGKYLLNDISVKHDTHNASSDLELFARQQPNNSFPLLGKLRLKMYNMSGQDTTKRATRFWHKLGEPPVIYDEKKTAASITQLEKEARNQGYLEATVDTLIKRKDKKISVTYHLHGGTPYRIRNYTYTIQDSLMAAIMTRVPLPPAIKTGDRFDMELLEQERMRINLVMRNAGYYNFSKELVYFKADTTLNSHQVDLFLNIHPSQDSLPYVRAKINNITIVSGINSQEATNMVQGLESNRGRGRRRHSQMRHADTTEYKDVTIIRGRDNFLRSTTLYKNLYIHKGQHYADRMLTRTYQAYNKMGSIKQVSITTKPSPEDSTNLIDATILLTPANAHWFRAALEGTNSAGDIGVAPSIAYRHQNIFNGSEQFGIKLKGAYEFITGNKAGDLMNQNFYEYGLETDLTFPLFLVPFLRKSWREMPTAQTRFAIGFNKQHRKEYTREFFNFTTGYNWTSNENRFMHNIDLFDINFIRMSSVSHEFDSLYLNNPKNPLLRETYKDQLIARTSYTFTMVNGRRFNPLESTYSFRTSIEVAGYLPRMITAIGKTNRDKDGQRKTLGVAYSEYVKANFDYTKTYKFSQKHSLALHANLGIAHPYGNSRVLPFERRFFSGGANSVRGWSTRRLGPGSYRAKSKDNTEFVNQAGDLKLEFSLENRHKIGSFLEFAEFVDAGNIWTIKKYDGQPGGQFKFDKFYKEIALAYGVGIRFDLSFLLLRLDYGLKAYDPAETGKKFVMFSPRWSRMAFHFGIGYPF